VDTSNLIQTILIYALPVLFAITMQEAAHGYAARYFGDNSAYVLGRITLNPVKHIDPIGTVVLPLLLLFSTSGAFVFGYAKPMPVNVGSLRNPKRDMIWVALAGPAANFAQAVLWAALWAALAGVGVEEEFFIGMARAGVLVNLSMWAFNLFPLPPLAGGRVLAGLLPWKASQMLSRVEPYGFFIVMALVYFKIVSQFWMTPLMTFGLNLIKAVVLSPLNALLR
jgi:Zn-dependent protease